MSELSAQSTQAELKFSKEQGFFDKSPGLRAMIAFLFMIGLFFFLHVRDVKVDFLELNEIAPNYIVAQVDFDFADEEATIISKQESVRDVGKIYQIAEKEIHKRRSEFEDFLTHDQSWRDQIAGVPFEEISKSLDNLEYVLKQARFTDPRTLKSMKQANLQTVYYLIYTPQNIKDKTKIPKQIWRAISLLQDIQEGAQPQAMTLAINAFSDKDWVFEEDIPAQRRLRKIIMDAVPQKVTHVSAGNRIIDQGDKVTLRNIAMLLSMKEALRKKHNLFHPITILGSIMMTLLLTVVSVVFLKLNYRSILLSNRKIFLLVSIVLLTLFLSKLTEHFLLSSMTRWIEIIRYPIFVPFAAIMVSSLLNAGVATYVSGFLVLVLSMTLAVDRQGLMVTNIVAAIVSILCTQSIKQRKEIFSVCFKAFLSCVAVAIAANFYQNGTFTFSMAADIINAAFFMTLTAIMVVGLLPLFESLFKIMTDVALMEYMDPNNDLLRRLSIEAPGTYQHSVVVGNLAETAALSIGANGLFCRAATLYHDIGKIVTPQYFTENQLPGMNIHQLLTLVESAQVIIAHVSEGVAMGRKAGLPEQFIDIIKEHHGTTLVYYFYKKQVEKMGGDLKLVDERQFRYFGPKPRSKESVIIMLSDSIEAAARSLDKVDEKSLDALATRLIKEKADDGQFDESLITFEELATVKRTLVKTLCAFTHTRVKYPTRDDKPIPDINS